MSIEMLLNVSRSKKIAPSFQAVFLASHISSVFSNKSSKILHKMHPIGNKVSKHLPSTKSKILFEFVYTIKFTLNEKD